MARPLKFETPGILDKKITDYFEKCKEEKRPLTMTGLALALDTTRETLLDYDERDEFSDSIKKARQLCENYAEEYLFTGKNVAGAIFNLLNNYKRWRQKTETEHSGGVQVKTYAFTRGDAVIPSDPKDRSTVEGEI